jgi:purine-cytosine permease-like protein
MAWFPLTFLAAYTFYKWERKEMPYKKYVGILTAILGGIISLVLLATPLLAMNIRKLIPYVDDKFAQANMAADVNWTGWEGLVGVIMVITLVFGLVRLKKRDYSMAATVLFVGTAIVIFLASAIIVPKVERYSQGAAVDFFIQRQGEDCYANVLGYGSYAQLFYTRKQPPALPNSYDEQWLLTGNIDKPAYFVSKVDRIDNYKQYTELKELYRKNGFVFLKREVPKK